MHNLLKQRILRNSPCSEVCIQILANSEYKPLQKLVSTPQPPPTIFQNQCGCLVLQIKCYQYWPCGVASGHVDQLEFGAFKIYYLQELRNEYFTIRSLELENMQVSMSEHHDSSSC